MRSEEGSSSAQRGWIYNKAVFSLLQVLAPRAYNKYCGIIDVSFSRKKRPWSAYLADDNGNVLRERATDDWLWKEHSLSNRRRGPFKSSLEFCPLSFCRSYWMCVLMLWDPITMRGENVWFTLQSWYYISLCCFFHLYVTTCHSVFKYISYIFNVY